MNNGLSKNDKYKRDIHVKGITQLRSTYDEQRRQNQNDTRITHRAKYK